MYIRITFSLRSKTFCNSIEMRQKHQLIVQNFAKVIIKSSEYFVFFCQIERAMLIKIILDLFTKGFLWFSLTTFSKLFRLLSFFERLEAFTFNNFTRFAVPSKIWNIYWNRFLWWKLDYIVALVFELLTYFICAFIILSCYSFQHYC